MNTGGSQKLQQDRFDVLLFNELLQTLTSTTKRGVHLMYEQCYVYICVLHVVMIFH